MKAFGLIIVLLLSGCGSYVRYVTGPDGTEWIAISCRKEQAICYESAGEECPNGYVIGDMSKRDESVTVWHGDGFISPRSRYVGEMFIKCRNRRHHRDDD